MTEDSVILKVKKLLALAESPNENEAARAAEKAQELMLRYGIELAQVASAKGEHVGVSHETLHGKLDPWRRQLASAVAGSMGGRFVYATEYRKWSGELEFWGERGTVPAMVALYQYLEGQLVVISAIERAKLSEVKMSAAKSMRWRRSFLWGATRRVAERLEARRETIGAEGDNSQALVVIKGAVDRALEDAYASLRNESSSVSIDRGAMEAGEEASANVDLGDAKIGRTKSELGRGAA